MQASPIVVHSLPPTPLSWFLPVTSTTILTMAASTYMSAFHHLESLFPSTSFSFLSSSSSSFLTSNSFPAAVTSSISEARSASCPPQTGFNAFAFLAFILIAIDTIMNINNNINNNNNNNNNNDRNNNNNNNFEAMNMNSRSFKENNLCPEVIPASLRLIDNCVKTQVASAEALLSNGSSPWSPEVWTAVAGGVQQTSLVGQCLDQTQARGVVLVWCEGGWRP